WRRRRSGVQRTLLNEAQLVAPGIGDVKRALAPWALQRLAGGLAMNLERRQRLERLGARMHRLHIAHRGVGGFRPRCRPQSASRRIEHREDHAAAIEVMASARVTFTLLAEQLGVEPRGLLDVRDFQGDAKDLRNFGAAACGGHRAFPFGSGWVLRSRSVDFGPEEVQVFFGSTGSRLLSQVPTTWRRRSRFSR